MASTLGGKSPFYRTSLCFPEHNTVLHVALEEEEAQREKCSFIGLHTRDVVVLLGRPFLELLWKMDYLRYHRKYKPKCYYDSLKGRKCLC